MRGAHVGDLRQRVDEPGVGGARGGGDEQGPGESGERGIEGLRLQDAVRGGDDDGFGQPEEPGGTPQGVVGSGAADEPDFAEDLPGEEQGQLVGLGAAGGDQGVGGARLLGEGPRHQCFEG